MTGTSRPIAKMSLAGLIVGLLGLAPVASASRRCPAYRVVDMRVFSISTSMSCRVADHLAVDWVGHGTSCYGGCYEWAGRRRWACLDLKHTVTHDGLERVYVRCLTSPGYRYEARFSYYA